MKKTNFKWRRFRYYWSKIDGAVYFLLLLVLVFVLWQTGALHAMLGQTWRSLRRQCRRPAARTPYSRTCTT